MLKQHLNTGAEQVDCIALPSETRHLIFSWWLQDADRSSRAFLGRLLQILADAREPAITRSAAASYVASFLSRAAFLLDSILMEHIAKLASWCLAYCQRHESEGNGLGYAGQGYVETPPQGFVHQVCMTKMQISTMPLPEKLPLSLPLPLPKIPHR